MKVAITGGIGSGKSEVMRIIKNRGYIVASADEINCALLEDVEYIKKIGNHFPNAVVDGKVDKTTLRNEIFLVSGRRDELNSIAHPIIRKKIDSIPDGAFVEVPLLFESGMQDMFDKVIVVTSKREIKIERIMTRGIEREIAEKMIDSQYPDEYKVQNADFVIKNNDDIISLEHKVDEIIALL